MPQYICTRLNYAHRKSEVEVIAAPDDDAACEKAYRLAAEKGWLDFELSDMARVVLCHRAPRDD